MSRWQGTQTNIAVAQPNETNPMPLRTMIMLHSFTSLLTYLRLLYGLQLHATRRAHWQPVFFSNDLDLMIRNCKEMPAIKWNKHD
jgi:hypothetical protein